MKVLIAVDGSECSKEAVDFVARRPWAPDDVFLMLHVIEPIPVDVGIAYIPAAYNQYDSESMARAELLLQKAKEIISARLPHPIETKVMYGNVKAELIDLAEKWGADLIVMGSHGRTGFDRFLLGSVAEEILRQSPCSVEIVKGKHVAQ